MYNFENKRVNDGKGIFYSRIIASWVVANGLVGIFHGDFEDWLRSLDLTDYEVCEIHELATCGRMECENNARKFIEEHRK